MKPIARIGLYLVGAFWIYLGASAYLTNSNPDDPQEATIASDCGPDAPIEFCTESQKNTHIKVPGADITIDKDSRSNIVVVADGMDIMIQKVDKIIDLVNIELLRRGLEPIQK